MKLGELYVRACALTPRSAKFAERLLSKAVLIPHDVRMSLHMALLDRIRSAEPPTETEWAALARPVGSEDARTHADAIEAHLFMQACSAFAAERLDGASTTSGSEAPHAAVLL